MKALDFILLCGELLIDVDIALENESVKQAINADASLEELRKILQTEF